MKPLVYIAGPMTKGDRIANQRNAIVAADAVLAAGGVPFVPHLGDMWELVSPKPYETWMEYDFEFVDRADILFRIPGESDGADREVARAQDRGLCVATCIDEVRIEIDELVRCANVIKETE